MWRRRRAGIARHAALSRDQERVVQQIPEPRELGAYGGLAEAEPLGGPRDIAFRQQRFERRKQIQIEFLGIHEIDSYA